MATSKRKAGKRAGTAGRSSMRALKTGLSKARKPGLSTPNPAKTGPRKQKTSVSLETTRLKRQLKSARKETQEALERQTATADILKVIASSPTKIESALKTIVKSVCRFCGAYDATLLLKDGNYLSYSAHYGPIPFPREPHLITRQWVTGRSVVDGKPVQVSDFLAPDAASEFPEGHRRASEQGHRCSLAVPLLREGDAIGAITLRRLEPLAFDRKQVALLQTFADQAVIAIENARLFTETQEALERQTATADILKVIASSPSDVQPVFEAIAERSNRLVNGLSTAVYSIVDDVQHLMAFTPINPAADQALKAFFPAKLSMLIGGETIRTGKIFRITDTEKLDDKPSLRDMARLRGWRSLVLVPLLRDNKVIGQISVTRKDPGSFADHHVALLQTFADQAVIAIENARLFTETQEALERQTATADVLKVISRSSVELGSVLNTLVETVARICRADQVYMFHLRHDLWHLIADCGLSAEARDYFRNNPFIPGRGATSGRAALERRAVHIPDVLQDPEYTLGKGQEIAGYRTTLGIPLLREDTLIGVYSLARTCVEPFTDKEIELATTFADQAVIAIENTRLFEELRDRQAELRVTFENMGDGVVMFGADTRLVAWNRNFQSILDLPDAFLAERPSYADYFRYLAERGEYSADLESDLSRANEDPRQELRLERTRPDGRIIEVRRNAVPDGGFVLIYADITERKRAEDAIRLARDAAEKALRDLQTAQDRLIQTEKLASLGQLTAGIAHEIKNPLNFVNNFSSLSAELVDELDETLALAPLDQRMRGDIRELTQMLKSNFEKVIQHGKRADSIVKNMLLHSRQGSGEHRPVDINEIVDESLNLAYHGARAEKTEFNITLLRNFDPAAGLVDVYPQEITRVLLNLISNGFYATTKRKAGAVDGFEPTLTATTRNLGDNVEIRIRDNGTGIPAEVKDKIFHPFFTTKPAGEGTGLGLSMSHDIIVKQHGGTIEVDTAPDAFTEFRIVLPRVGHP